jgi:hypothetical protein
MSHNLLLMCYLPCNTVYVFALSVHVQAAVCVHDCKPYFFLKQA